MSSKVCSFEGCTKSLVAKGLCGSHYAQHQRGSALRPLKPAPSRKACSVDGCAGTSIASTSGHPMCSKHYQLWRKYGQAELIVSGDLRAVPQTTFESAADAFYMSVDDLGGSVVGEYKGAHKRVHCVCRDGHDCYPAPHSLSMGQGLCAPCAGKIWDAFYVVTDGDTTKFGITSGNPGQRIRAHRRDGLAEVLRLSVGMPPKAAPWLEAQCLTVLRESGAEPVRGREYFDARQWGDLILGIVDRFS